jgi:hypothetical protein
MTRTTKATIKAMMLLLDGPDALVDGGGGGSLGGTMMVPQDGHCRSDGETDAPHIAHSVTSTTPHWYPEPA